jgi:osmotically inducible protein OsmC
MSFVRLLGMVNFVPEQLKSKSEVVIDKDGDGFSITSVHLTVTAKIPGIDQAGVPVNRGKSKGRLPCLQTDEGRDWLRSHSPFVSLR